MNSLFKVDFYYITDIRNDDRFIEHFRFDHIRLNCWKHDSATKTEKYRTKSDKKRSIKVEDFIIL